MFNNANLNTLLLDLLPILAALCAWLYQWGTQRLPDKQRSSLEQFARMAANKIEQVFPDAGSINKKQLATTLVVDLFQAFGLPVPDARAIDAAIESAVLLINQVQSAEGSSAAPVAAPTEVAQ